MQEWVASLPIPHLLERQNHEASMSEAEPEPNVQSCAAFEKAEETSKSTAKVIQIVPLLTLPSGEESPSTKAIEDTINCKDASVIQTANK